MKGVRILSLHGIAGVPSSQRGCWERLLATGSSAGTYTLEPEGKTKLSLGSTSFIKLLAMKNSTAHSKCLYRFI
ncbi:hypothetical protein [Methylacidiphilum kamchatkense]|uniref:Uncharacterized protein n=1 Tax=Methylacidiphilum kamchatkense Kam1 TaxID=1202785 RepID=A0A516TK49_9BACT|nr:hypothetical protein [Methylacidiphilum kamchatkense]QDQ41544.1 hypothetical protein kam1_290 [Methylacidiphilum kamchatkense Kam1]